MPVLLLIQISCLLCLGLIFLQDLKERQVYLGVLFLGGGLMAVLHYLSVPLEFFIKSIGLNIILLIVIIIILSLYTKYKMKLAFKQGIGLGDLTFFFFLALSFPSYTFLSLFVASLCFSLLVFLGFKSKLSDQRVPLAGLQALFFGLFLSVNWLFNLTELYQF